MLAALRKIVLPPIEVDHSDDARRIVRAGLIVIAVLVFGIGCQHPVIAVAVQTRGRDQRGQPLDQFHRREAQLGAPIGLGLGQAIDELVVGELLEPLQCEGRASAIA